jgi:hypothetical protein
MSADQGMSSDGSAAVDAVNEEATDSPLRPSSPVYRVHQVAEFAPGIVIHGLSISETLSNDFNPSDRHQMELASDPPRRILWKFRYMVVTAVFESHYLAAPIFTKSGNGIGNVPERDRPFYMSLKDHRLEEHANPTSYPVLETESMEIATFLNPKSLVLFTCPVPLFMKHAVKFCGRLTPKSTAALLGQHVERLNTAFATDRQALIESLRAQATAAQAKVALVEESITRQARNSDVRRHVASDAASAGQASSPNSHTRKRRFSFTDTRPRTPRTQIAEWASI